MRQTCIFSGSSHPRLVDSICERLGKSVDKAELRKFSNGETSVEIKTSVRDQDVFIVQSGSSKINDNVMEMLIMINACRGGSSRSITAVMPYFPYSRQSKRKSHRGAITARMLANLMNVAGVNHVITIDLHASQSQGFFKCPVDNLIAEPILAKWIKNHVKDWQDAVVVSKNPGGTKRVTSLADALKLSFGIVTTDTRRPHMSQSFDMLGSGFLNGGVYNSDRTSPPDHGIPGSDARDAVVSRTPSSTKNSDDVFGPTPNGTPTRRTSLRPSRLSQTFNNDNNEDLPLSRVRTALATTSSQYDHTHDSEAEDEGDGEGDERARDVVTGRLIHGHIVPDDHPSVPPTPAIHPLSRMTRADSDDGASDTMAASFLSIASAQRGEHGLGGTGDAAASDEEEEEILQDPGRETTITLVGDVRRRPVFIVDDIIDKAASWIAAAETAVKRGGATEVYCMATHGLFGGNSLSELQECSEITKIVVTNAFPVSDEKARNISKLVTLDVSNLLAEAIRRNHHGESISALYQHYD